MAAMPGVVTLLPLDQSNPSTSRIEENTSARQRRRKTSRNTDSKKSTRSNLTESGLELVSLESSGSRSPRDWPRTGVSRGRGNIEDSRGVDSQASALGSSGPQDVAVSTSLNSTARQRRVRRERTRHSPSGSRSHPEPNLEDSTDGVARILKRRLQLLELDESKQSTVICNKDHADLSSGMVTECDEEVPQEGLVQAVDTAKNTGRPLPPPSNEGDGESKSDGSHDSNATPPSTDILGITIHGTDELQASVLLSHPSIRVSVINGNSGELLKKSVPEKCVTSYYERGNPSVDYILPILTQPFECRRHRALKGTLKAQWEEALTFNEQLSYFTLNEDVVIFFELLDFVSGQCYASRMMSEHKPWHRIAWAFLCPAGKACTSKLGSKIRLQFYKYPKSVFGHSTESGEVYNLWCGHYRSTYPSTLYVTVSGISTDLPQEDSTANRRSLFPFQEEKGSISFEQMVKLQVASKSFMVTTLPTSTLASGSLRLPGQPCQIPTSLLSTHYPTPMGCSSLAFSHSGHLLAAGCADQSTLYPLVIYEIPSFTPVMVTEGHRGIIYQVCWSQDDNLLASVSADGIVKLWCLDGSSLQPLATLPHPCYVYSACFITGAGWEGSNVLATGAYDGYIRIWSMSDNDTSIQIVGEFRGHYGQVNCLVWSKKAAILYAGDSKGVLGAWHKKKGMWMLKRKTDVMNGQSFTTINLHPNDRKLLLHTRKAKLAMLDLRIDHICCEYSGIQPAGLERCASLLSPCGRMVFAGTTRGTVHVWSADTGKGLHVYSGLPFTSAVSAMAFHPSEHMLVLSSFGECQPLVALNHLIGSQPVAGQRGGERAVAPLMTPRPREVEESKEGGGAGRVELLGAQLEGSRRWKDLVKTLDKVTKRAKS